MIILHEGLDTEGGGANRQAVPPGSIFLVFFSGLNFVKIRVNDGELWDPVNIPIKDETHCHDGFVGKSNAMGFLQSTWVTMVKLKNAPPLGKPQRKF